MYEVVHLIHYCQNVKGLLNFVCERIKLVYRMELSYSVQLLKKIAVFQSSKTTITPHTSELKSISKYQLLTPVLFEDV